MRGHDCLGPTSPHYGPAGWQNLLLYGDRNVARGIALRACIKEGRAGGKALYMQQRMITIDDSAFRSSGGSENVVLGVFDSLGEVANLISNIRPSVAVIDPANGATGRWGAHRRLALDLFEIATAADRIHVRLILLCEMTEWNGTSRPRHYATIRKFCDQELEVSADPLAKGDKLNG